MKGYRSNARALGDGVFEPFRLTRYDLNRVCWLTLLAEVGNRVMPMFEVKRMQELAEPLARGTTGISPCSACSVRQLTICADLAADELNELSSIVSSVELGPGDPLFDEEEKADYVFNVTAGKGTSRSQATAGTPRCTAGTETPRMVG